MSGSIRPETQYSKYIEVLETAILSYKVRIHVPLRGLSMKYHFHGSFGVGEGLYILVMIS